MPDSAPSSSSSEIDSLVKTLLSGASEIQGKWRKALTYGYAAHRTYRSGKALYLQVRSTLSHTITVMGTDAIYDDLNDWVLAHMPDQRRRAMIARTQDRGPGMGAMDTVPYPGDYDPPPQPKKKKWVVLGYNGDREHTIEIGGHQIKVFVEKMGQWGGTNRLPSRYHEDLWNDRRYERIVFTCANMQARDAVVKLLEDIAAARFTNTDVRKPEFHLSSSWGDFRRRNDIPRRTLDTVILREGQKEEIIEQFDAFFANESRYAALGQPWHLGVLLEGPPGGGKTSLAKALATHYGMDVYAIPLGDLRQDAGLMDLVASVRPGSMLLLEDIDIFAAVQGRDLSEADLDDGDGKGDEPARVRPRARSDAPADNTKVYGGATLSGLLNAIDGVSTPHGLITVMTTNRASVLDEALIRPGRVDHQHRIDYIDTIQAKGLVEMFYGPEWADRVKPVPEGSKVSAAQIAGAFKDAITDPQAGIDALNALTGSA